MSSSRSSATLHREHITIAPIPPTVLKTGGAKDNENGVLYMGDSLYHDHSAAHGFVYDSGAFLINRGVDSGSLYDSPSDYEYDYDGYGYCENVSAGRFDASERTSNTNTLTIVSLCATSGRVQW